MEKSGNGKKPEKRENINTVIEKSALSVTKFIVCNYAFASPTSRQKRKFRTERNEEKPRSRV